MLFKKTDFWFQERLSYEKRKAEAGYSFCLKWVMDLCGWCQSTL